MVNRVRTLLLNLRAATTPFQAGEEYVPPDYVPASLPQELLDTRAALFGDNPTRAGLNLLLARLLGYLHTSPLVGDLTSDDPRITYDPADPAPDANPEATTHDLLSVAVSGLNDSDRLFRPNRSESEKTWLGYWLDPLVPSPLRIGALALALAARTKDVLNGTYDG